MEERGREECDERTKEVHLKKEKGNGRRMKAKRIKRKEIQDERQKEQKRRSAQMD
jgi:hypothetical protein